MAIILALTSCPAAILARLDNPADPQAPSYQGFTSVKNADEIEAVSPANGVEQVFQYFAVNKVLGAQAHRLQIATDASFVNTVFDSDTMADRIMKPQASLVSGTTYYWRAAAKLNGQWGKFTTGRSFRMESGITSMSPADGTGTDDTTPAFSWNAVAGANEYQLQIADSEEGLDGSPTVDVTVSGTGYTPATGLDWKTYYWRVRAVDGDGQYVEWSAVATLSVRDIPDGFVFVEVGTFTMGSPSSESGRESDEGPQHEVTVSSFYISQYEVTHRQYIEFLNGAGVSSTGQLNGNEVIDMDDSDVAVGYTSGSFTFKGSSYATNENTPVIEVTWYGGVEYANWLSNQSGLTPAYTINGNDVSWNRDANGYRLPTEAEWEYAARGGNQSKGYVYSGSNTVGDVAWYYSNSGSETHNVGTKQANELGLYDMSGNVWKWCWDWYGSYSSTAQTDPPGPSTGSSRVLRGGGWYGDARNVRVANRNNNSPGNSNNNIGIRPVLPVA